MTRSRWLLVGLVVVYLLAAGVYAALIPVFEGFDAQAHFAAIQYYRSERTVPELTPETAERSQTGLSASTHPRRGPRNLRHLYGQQHRTLARMP